MNKPGRPFGVTLAIVASVCLFSILPLLQVGLVLSVRQHFLNMNFQDSGLDTIAMGGDLLGVPESSLILQSVLSIAFLVIGIMAWRGKPSSIRFMMIAAVVLLTVVKFVSVLVPLLSQPDFQQGTSSLDGVLNSLGAGQFVFDFFILLYVVWYMNRGPARAFYRGYYLPDPAVVPSET
ncbi:MAG: hypothetical protein ABI690_30395 [Chloroflexota bacterium]